MGKLATGRPYSGPGDDSLPDNVQALPEHAREIWVAAFNGAYKSWDSEKTDLEREPYAFAVAWAAVKKLYKQKDGKWVKRSIILLGEGHLSRVWRSADGQHRWQATVMDDGVDEYATRMTIDFQDDICAQASAGAMPWLGIAHYDSYSKVGEITRLYRDGRYVKAEGYFLTDADDQLMRSLAEAAFESAQKESDLLPAHRAIAVSQCFYPEAYVIEDCGVVGYTAGRMDHLALTTRAANSRADFGVEEDDMSKRATKTRRELRRQDAAAIVGEDLAQTLFEREEEHGERTAEQDGLVYRAGADGGGVEVSPDGGDSWQEVEAAGARAMVPTHRPALNEAGTAWDAAAARKRIWAFATDGDTFDAKKARQGFAIYDSDNPDNKTGMALPHHDVAGGKIVTHQKGVLAAGGVTMGARGGIKEFQKGDNESAQRHLVPHYGQMDRTPPWRREESDLRHWAEAMEELEALAELGLAEAADVERGRAFLRHRLEDGTIAKPTVAEARTMLFGDANLAAALLRAVGKAELADAIRAIVSDPEGVGAAPQAGQTPAGRHRDLEPDADYRSELVDRYGAEPDDSVIETLNENAIRQLAYEAGYTFLDIVIANVTAEEEVTLQDRLGNVQRALNEFGEIIKDILAHSVQPRSTGKPPPGTGAGVKPGGDNPPAGVPAGDPREGVLTELERIRTLVVGGVRDADSIQEAVDQLVAGLTRCVDAPQADLEDALMPILERLTAIEDRIEARGGPDGGDPPGNEHARARGAPPRRKAFQPTLEGDIRASPGRQRPGPKGWTPQQFSRGAHRERVFDPHV